MGHGWPGDGISDVLPAGGGIRVSESLNSPAYPAAVVRLHFIRKAQRLGLKLEEIRAILGQRARGQLPCGSVVAFAERHLEQMERQLRELTAARDALRAQLRRWKRNRTSERCATADYCSLIEELGLE